MPSLLRKGTSGSRCLCSLSLAVGLWAATAAGQSVVAPPKFDSNAPGQNPTNAPQLLPAPDKATRARAEALIRQNYAADFARHTTADKETLARKLLDLSGQTQDDAVGRYTLLALARELTNTASTALAAVDAIAASYQVDAVAMKMEVYTRFSSRATAAENAQLAKSAQGLADEQMAQENWATAMKLVSIARSTSYASHDSALATEMKPWLAESTNTCAAGERLQASLTKLQTHPEDKEANLTVGRFYCLTMGKWEKGLPMLARSADPQLAEPAKEDLGAAGLEPGPDHSEALTKVGNAWWGAAATGSIQTKGRLRERAAVYYTKALTGASGLSKTLIEQRLGQIGSGGTSSAGSSSLSHSSAGTTGTIHLLPLIDEKSLGHRGKIENGAFVPREGATTFPCHLPHEFDVSLEFTRPAPVGALLVSFPLGRGTCSFCLGAEDGHRAMFGEVKGAWLNADNPSLAKVALEKGKRYSVVIKVRNGGAEASLDGKPICTLQSDGDPLMARLNFQASSGHFLAVGAYEGEVAIHSIDVRGVGAPCAVVNTRDEFGTYLDTTLVPPDSDGSIHLTPQDATRHGSINIAGDGIRGGRRLDWMGNGAYISWNADVRRAGSYNVSMFCKGGTGIGAVDVTLGPEGAAGLKTKVSAGNDQREISLGTIHLAPGKQTLDLKTTTTAKSESILQIWQVILTPSR